MTPGAAEQFQDLRGRLFSMAYRMLGSRVEAEDVVQEAHDIRADQGDGQPAAGSRGSGLELPLPEQVKIRASQINGCAYCIDMHTKDARAMGETEQRIYALSAWPTPFFSDRERAALQWTEALTRVGETHVPDPVFEAVRARFDENEIVALTFAAIAANSWNRLAVALRAPAGSYEREAVQAQIGSQIDARLRATSETQGGAGGPRPSDADITKRWKSSTASWPSTTLRCKCM